MFNVPALPYAYEDLEPYVSAQIMKLHHDKHHQTYVDNLNKALEKYPEWGEKTIEEIIRSLAAVPEDIRTAVRNNGGGHYNHSLFWEMMRPGRDENIPSGQLQENLQITFGDFEKFKEEFSTGATKIFGSGWEWLVLDEGDLKLVSTANQDSPVTEGMIPLLGLDVWEHAYYLQYYNKRADYIASWWHVVNWETVEKRFLEAQG